MPFEVELHKINFSYKEGHSLFNNLNLSFKKGDFCFIVGTNGSGKSTLIHLILGKLTPLEGKVSFTDLEGKNNQQRSALVGYVPQEQSLDGEMSVEDIIRFKAGFHFLFGKKLDALINSLAIDLGITDLLSKQIKQLSGGQKQLVNIILGIIHQPDIILLDEPFVGLDFDKIQKVIRLLKQLNTTIICVSHDLDLVEQHADRILLFEKGILLQDGNPRQFIHQNAYVYQEIILKNSNKFVLSNNINLEAVDNKLIISYPLNQENEEEVNGFLKENSELILELKTTKNTLKSSIIGIHKGAFAVQEAPLKKGKGGGDGSGSGGGNRKNKL